MNKRLDTPKRIVRIESLLGKNTELAYPVAKLQQGDGGWSDVEETLWCIRLLMQSVNNFEFNIVKGLTWLKAMQHKEGGWGLSSRDLPRIPATGLVTTILPQLGNKKALVWLAETWENDLNADIKLTYKGGFTLMSLSLHQDKFMADNLVTKTIKHLENEQNIDGGYGPWKNHPIGSDPWSTGITLAGLSSWPDKVSPQVIERSVEWLCNNQLDSGLWAYHFIDEGSAYAYWGLVKAIECLDSINGKA